MGKNELTKHQIHGTNYGDGIGQQVTLADMIETTQVSESRSTDVASIRTLTTVTDNINTHLTLGSLNDRVSLARGNSVALCVQEEVVDESLHVLLHGGTGRRGDLVVLDTDRAPRHLVQALVDDAQGLAELLHSAEVAVVAVAVLADGDVELNLVVGIIGLALSDIPGHAGTSQHDTGEGEIESLGGGDDTNAPQSLDPDTVVGKHFFRLIDTVTELRGPLVDVVEQTYGDILVNTAGTNIGGVETSTRNTFVELLWLKCQRSSREEETDANHDKTAMKTGRKKRDAP
jgi:hypothetical protein